MLKRMVSPLVLALALSGTAFAQSEQPGAGMSTDEQTAASPSSSATGQSGSAMSGQFTVNQLLDMNVKSSAGENVGSVENLIIDQSGRISGVVVSVGGFLGIGDKKVALPWNQVTMQPGQQDLTTSATKQQLQQAQAWQEPDEQTAQQPGSRGSQPGGGATSGSGTYQSPSGQGQSR